MQLRQGPVADACELDNKNSVARIIIITVIIIGETALFGT
jgi:hypothetical protein